MFKSARWRSEKNKVKAVFKLQFHATQVVGDALMISLVPADVGKPTTKLNKSAIRDGSCSWKYPVYETVNLVQEPKTGKIHNKFYHFLLSSEIHRVGLVGEASLNFAEYAEAIKPSSVSLPLRNSSSGALLHVTIQRILGNVAQSICREVEGKEDVKIKTDDGSLRSKLGDDDIDEHIASNYIEDDSLNKTMTHASEINGCHRASSGSDITMSSSESSSGLNTPREVTLKNSKHQEPTSFLLVGKQTSEQEMPAANASPAISQACQISQSGSDNGLSTDDLTSSSQETVTRDGSGQASDNEIEKIKGDLATIARQAEVSELEIQTLRKQIIKESKRGQDLSREVVCLKKERDELKAECEKLKVVQKRVDHAKVSKSLFDGADFRSLLEELQQELVYEKELNANLRIQLQKTQESNSQLILAVQDLEEMLEQNNREVSQVPCVSVVSEEVKEQEMDLKCQTDDDEEQKALEELVKEHDNAKEAYLLEQKIVDLCSELEICRKDKDELEMQMEQLALDYEILKQENHNISYRLEQIQIQEQLKMPYDQSSSFPTVREVETQIESLENELKKQSEEFSESLARKNELESQIENMENELKKQSKEFSESLARTNELETQIENMENELKKQSKEFSESLARTNELKTHIKGLEEELENQTHRFEADLEALTRSKVEQEQRAIRAEEALRKTRWRNASTAERLQKEFGALSMQIASAFDANKKLTTKAMVEAAELQLQKSHLEGRLEKTQEEFQSLKDDYGSKLSALSNQLNSKTSQIEELMLKIESGTKQVELHKKHEEELQGALSHETSVLRAEIENLRRENDFLSEQAEQYKPLRVELELMMASLKEKELLLQKGIMEREKLEDTVASLTSKVEKSLEELNSMRHLREEDEAKSRDMDSQLRIFRVECAELRQALVEDEMEKEKLRKAVFQLKNDLKKKEDALVKQSKGRVIPPEGINGTPRSNRAVPESYSYKQHEILMEKIKVLEGQIKVKESTLEASTNSFLEREKYLQNKIEDLESRVEELNQFQFQKLAKDAGDITTNGSVSSGMVETFQNSSLTAGKPQENAINDGVVAEMAIIKDRNKLMESELKEMQERYSEISLKFAEVEGERQQLIMTLRNLKNAKKS